MFKFIIIMIGIVLVGCSSNGTTSIVTDTDENQADQVFIGEITWSDADFGKLADLPFRLRDVDAPETGGVGAAIGGTKCEQERILGQAAKEFIQTLTSNAAITITNDYGPDRFGRYVVNLDSDGIDVAQAGLEAGHLRPWPHDDTGNSLSEKPDWCI